MKLSIAAAQTAVAAAFAVVFLAVPAHSQLGRPPVTAPPGPGDQLNELLTRDTPVIARLRINAGAQFTANRVVVLDIDLGANASRVTQYRASERADLSDAQWLPFQPRPSFNVSIGNGQKTIYLQVRGPTNILTPATRDGLASSRIASDTITFANPRLVDVELENGAGFSHDAIVSVKVAYEGSANLYRVSDRNDFEGVNWRNLNGTTFNFTFPSGASVFGGALNRRSVYVQVANGSDYISETLRREIDLVRAITHTVPLGPALDEARAENYVVSATSRNNEWICEFGRFPGSDLAELRATPSAHLAGTGYAGSDTCTFRIFEGRKLKAPWLLQEFTYVGGTVEGEGIPVMVDAPTALSNDAGMTITWSMPATGILPTTYHRGFLGELKLAGPENGDWRDAFE
jgi:hypothetical protein